MSLILVTLFTNFNAEEFLALVAGLLIIIAQVLYIINTFKRKVQPSILSWLGWAILTGTSLVSQFMVAGWKWDFTGLFLSTVGCVIVSIVAISNNNFSLRKKDWQFVILGFICMGIYLASKNPWATTIFAIFADLILGVPTIRKAYLNPDSEKSSAWLIGLISWTFTLFICVNHGLLFSLFPLYLFLFNVTMVYLTSKK